HVEDSLNAVSAVDTRVLNGEVCFEAEHFSPYAVVSIEDNTADPSKVIEPQDLIESVSVTVGGKEFSKTGANKISKDDKIEVIYTFKEPLVVSKSGKTSNGDGYYVKAGDSYELPSIPAELANPAGYKINVENGGKILGEITVDATGKAVLKIADASSFSDPFTTATEVSAKLDLYLNADVKADTTKDSYDLTIGGNTYKIKIDEFSAKPPTVKKTASDIDADGNVTWTVTLTNAAKPIDYASGYSIKDTFGKGQNYVEGSFAADDGSSITPTVSGSTISWNYTNNTASNVVKFTYKTHVDFVALTKDTNKSDTVKKEVSNNVVITAPAGDDYEALSIKDTAKSTVSKTVDKWIDKTCTSEVNADGEAEWKIVIKNNGFTLKDVILHDNIITDKKVTITMSDITVKDASNKDVAFTESSSGDSHDIKFTGKMTGNAVYTVTYKTKIENYAKYLKENHSVPKNKAWIEYDYDATGKDGWTNVTGPSLNVDFKGTGLTAKAAIEKRATGVNAVDHTLNWEVLVNKNMQALEEVVVTDAIQAGQEYVSISDVKIDGIAASPSDYTIDDSDLKNVKVVFGDNIKGKTAYFKVVTKLTDAENAIWGSNASKEYSNKVVLSSKGNEDVPDSATQKFTSTVIEKTAGNYDYSTHLIHYTITVNHNKMPMTGVVVTDPLDSRLEYVDGSSTAANTAYDTATNTVTFAFDSITDKTVIEFDAKVKDGETFENNGSFSITNEAGVVSTEYPGSTSVSTKTDIVNKVIDKKGKQDKEVVTYTVELNVAKQDLYRSGIGEVVIQDTIGASLVLDESTVKLYEATVNSDGSLKQASAVDGITVRVDRSNPKTVLEVVVPNDGGGKSYILEYTARMLNKKANDFANDVILKGYGDGAKNSSKVEYKASQFGSVNFDNYVYYISGLKDENDKDLILAGAHFELLDPEQGNKVIDETDSDVDGEIMFVGTLKENHDYILKETKAKDGYEIPDELKDGVTVHTGDKGYAKAYADKDKNTVYNSKPSRLMTFDLLDGKNKTTDLTKTGDDPSPVKITVYKDGKEVWNSDSATPFKAIYGTEYEVKESKTPFGYHGDSVSGYKFMIEEGTGELKLTSTPSENVVLSGDKITIYDSPKENMAIKVNDISKAQGNYLKGAKFVIKNGTEVVKTWDSDGDFKDIVLPEGDYTLERTDEPAGFVKANKVMKFSVKKGALGDLELEVTDNTDG
ncbi:MAG: hypothetical protein IKZ94_01705, partial [Lachnospiraceae bacterium]|nr:hypothetical protein [Lachnospiraceae bacterium]